jgi:hypothetical protein
MERREYTVGYATTNVIDSRTSFVIASVRSSIHLKIYVFRGNPFQNHSLQHSYHPTQSVPVPQPTAQLPSNTIRSSPTAYSTVTIQHNHLNRKNITQNQKYNSKNNIKLIYLTFIHCTNKQITELN